MRARRTVLRSWVLALALGLVAFVGVAVAAGNSVHIQAPRHAHLGSTITVTFSGNTSGAAPKFLAAFIDQTGSPCAATGVAEAGRPGVGAKEKDFFNLGGHYVKRARIVNLQRSYICAYLQVRNKAAGYPTIAHAGYVYR
jgi:predicted secreted protein